MKKIIIALIGVMLSMQMAIAAVSITTSAKTFQKAGGAASIVVTGDDAWTATSDSSWIVIKQGASGTGAGSCVYIVNANTTADVRIGHITLGGNTYTITQYGYEASISPKAASFDRRGGSGTISVTVDAGVSWSAVANNDWISVSPASGLSVGTVNYTVAEYPGVVSRVGSITIGGKTFTITQTGVDVSISPESVVKGEAADIIAVTINALATTQWTVTPNDPWISVIDKAIGYGDYVLTLAINANPSFERRTGTVSIGTATLTISQAGTTTASLSIDPATATAAASGAYGNVAVYATPDAVWTAESTAPWLTISEGATGAGNGNIKYVASANPTLSERTGQIIVTPPHKVIEPDLWRGLLFLIVDGNYNVEGNDDRSATHSLKTTFNGSFNNPLSGTEIPAKGSIDFSMGFSFKVGELGCINRLLRIAQDRHFYLDTDNRLRYAITSNATALDKEITTSLTVDAADKWYTLVIRQDESRNVSIFAGERDSNLKRVAYFTDTKIFGLDTGSVSIDNIVFGSCNYPSAGNLQSGQVVNIRFWNRALSDTECSLIDIRWSADMSEDDVPLGAPDGVKWDYFPLDGNAYRTRNTSMTAFVSNTKLTGWTDSDDRYGSEHGAVASTGNGKVTISDFQGNFGIFEKSEVDATYSFWINLAQLPKYNVNILKRAISGSSYGDFTLSLTSDGCLNFYGDGTTTTTFTTALSVNKWHFVTIVGKSGKSVQVFIDGVEIGNITSALTMGYDSWTYYPTSGNSKTYWPILTLGGWNGAVDGLTFFHSALTSAQVRELYERQRVQKVVHTVTQGVQSAQVNKDNVTAPAEGSTESVALTLAQGVQWTAQSNSSWIQITSDTDGAGSASIEFTIGANPAVTSRTGSITIAGKNVTVVQEGLRSSVECEDTSFGVESDSGIVWVETEGGGTWTASTDVDWIHLFEESGTGSTPVMFVVDDYTTTTQSRTGVITIAGKKVVITQQGYELSIDPKVADVGSNASAGQFGVAAPIDAVWEAIADCDWITIIGARTGIGDGIIQYTIADNLTGETRTGRIVVGGKTYAITQRTTLPLTTRTVGSGSVTGAGNYNQGTQVILKAIPAQGYEFSHWSGDAVGVTDSVKIDMDTAKNVTATFIPEAAAQVLAEKKAAQGGFYTRDQIHALEVGNLVLDVDSASGTARVGVQLMETSDLSDPNSWKPVNMTQGNLDVGNDGTVGLNVKASGNAKFFKVVVPKK